MADSLPSPPVSRGSTPHIDTAAPNADDLICRLDELLEQYLEILAEYTILREKLSKSFSDGFMSLAHAQRTSNLGPGRRYGQDGYDGRMRALRRVNVDQRGDPRDSKTLRSGKESDAETHTSEGIGYDHQFNIVPYPQKVQASTGKDGEHEDRVSKIETDSSNLSTEKEPKTVQGGNQAGGKLNKPKIDPAYRDPVTWYGILVPPALRQSQKNFTLCVEDMIPQLLSTTSHLQSLESKIWALREEIGVKDTLLENEAHSMPHRQVEATSQ